jgi:lysophospholipase L1-like esterase
MDVVEARIFDRGLSLGDRANWLAYAQAKYGVYMGPITAQVFAYGNSITAGYGLTDGGAWPIQLKNSLSTTTEVYNLGRSSAATTDLTSHYVDSVVPFYKASLVNVMIPWEVRNDICGNGTAGSTAYTNYVTLCQAAKATGFKVIAVTAPTSTGCSGAQLTAITALNASVLAGYPYSTGTVNTSGTTVTWVSGATFANVTTSSPFNIAGTFYTVQAVNSNTSITLTGTAGTQTGATYTAGFADAVADVATPINACSGTCFQGDGVHLNDQGQSVAAGLLLTAINSLGVY